VNGGGCPGCGFQNATGAGTCARCGAALEARITPVAPPPGNEFQEVADKVGLVPNLRPRDNLVQGLAVLGTTILGVIVGLLTVGGRNGALFGALAGIVAGGLISGLVLMAIGLTRR
jgi:hypothetical protein